MVAANREAEEEKRQRSLRICAAIEEQMRQAKNQRVIEVKMKRKKRCILFHKADMEKVKRFFGNDLQFIPYDEDNMMVTLRTRITVSLFHSILNFGEHAKILSPKEAIGEFFVFMKTRMRNLDELYGYGTPEFLADVPTNYDTLRAQQHKFKHTPRIRKRK